MKRSKVPRPSRLEINKYLTVADKTSDQVIITNPTGTIIYANQTAEKYTGYSRKELIGQNVMSLNLWGGWMGRYFYWNLWPTVKKEKKKFVAEIINRRKNNTKYITRLRVYPVMDNKKKIKYIVGLEKNITARKEIDQAKTEFITLASHQLRTPLTNISLSLDVLLRDPAGGLSEYQKERLRGIYHSVHGMAGLISTLLDASRIKLGSFLLDLKPVNIIQVAECALNQIMPDINSKKLKLTKEYDETIPRVMSDKNIIKTILANLLSNAVKYTPKKGLVNFRFKIKNNNILFEISDSGWGIPDAEQDRVFSKYFRAENIREKDAGGSGLGLYLTQLLIRSIQGKIWFNSHENEGTSFYVQLPMSEYRP